jgi:predicted nucleotidyltransferase
VIPSLIDGVLPDGIHSCTIEEVDEAFGRYGRTGQRFRLTEKLRSLLGDAKKSGIVAAVVIDGSYVTKKEEPGDIDVVIALRQDFDLEQELRPFEYEIQSKRRVKEKYRFDAKVAVDGSDVYLQAIEFFAQVRTDDPDQATQQTRKGLLRIEL